MYYSQDEATRKAISVGDWIDAGASEQDRITEFVKYAAQAGKMKVTMQAWTRATDEDHAKYMRQAKRLWRLEHGDSN
jgi:hypothetical protein